MAPAVTAARSSVSAPRRPSSDWSDCKASSSTVGCSCEPAHETATLPLATTLAPPEPVMSTSLIGT